MSGPSIIKIAVAAALLFSLTACLGPTFIFFDVINDAVGTNPSSEAETYCNDELRATLVWGGKQVEVTSAPGESLGDRINDGYGDVTVEAWCVRDGEEVGYARLQRTIGSAPVPEILVFPPAKDRKLRDDTFCETPDEHRGVPICVMSHMF